MVIVYRMILSESFPAHYTQERRIETRPFLHLRLQRLDKLSDIFRIPHPFSILIHQV